MRFFADTGVLLRVFHRPDANHATIRAATAALLRRQVPVFTGLQQFAEFWNVTTKPVGQRGGFDLPVALASRRLRFLQRSVNVLIDTPDTPRIWQMLVERHEVRGVKVHDARMVALMLTHSMTDLLSLNSGDFRRYDTDGIRVRTPTDVLDQLG